ncbi:MAG: hypothetical protein M3164_05440 [Actinomycetota bacterium]|nr:hypothetical protein [Actinomycetota bacterium]
MRKNLARVIVAVPLLIVMMVLTPVWAWSSPLQSVTASAFGLEATGIIPIARTPTVSVTFPPPAERTERADLLQIPAEPLAFNGTATAVAQTAREATLASSLRAGQLQAAGGGTVPDRFNARGASRIEGLGLLTQEPLPGLPEDLTGSLVGAELIEAEAVVSCVEGRPVFAAGSNIVGLVIAAGLDLTQPLDDLLRGVVDTVRVPGILEINRNIVTPTADGISVIALQVRLLGNGEVVNLAQAQVSGGVCAPVDRPECSDGIDNDGDGKIDAADPGCHTDGDPNNPASYDPNDDDERDLVRTGGWGPGGGIGIMLGALLLMFGAYRLRRWSLITEKQ